jgi:hypothetical protein
VKNKATTREWVDHIIENTPCETEGVRGWYWVEDPQASMLLWEDARTATWADLREALTGLVKALPDATWLNWSVSVVPEDVDLW